MTRLAKISMVAGLTAGYGTCGVVAIRYLLPAEGAPRAWLLVGESSSFAEGASIAYAGPSGQTITIIRRSSRGDAEDFVALSRVCPHLGCQVHWRPDENQFVCPCHNGVFDRMGRGIAGPPAKAGQSLSRFPLKVESGLLFVEVPLPTVGERSAHEHPLVAIRPRSKALDTGRS